VPSPDFLGNLYRLAEADARVHLKGGVGQYGRHAAVQYAPLRDADSAARPLFVGPFDPLIEELAALASFRCCWTEDQDGAALDEGLADAVGIVLRGEDVRALHQRAGKGRKMLMLGVRCEGVCRRPGAQRAAAGPAPAADLAAEGFERNGPWAGAAAVAAGVRESAPCTRFIAKSFGLDFEEADGCPYVAVWQEGPGRRFPWGIALKAALSGLSDAADALGWKYIGSRNEVVS
jgi:hypothetical protein